MPSVVMGDVMRVRVQRRNDEIDQPSAHVTNRLQIDAGRIAISLHSSSTPRCSSLGRSDRGGMRSVRRHHNNGQCRGSGRGYGGDTYTSYFGKRPCRRGRDRSVPVTTGEERFILNGIAAIAQRRTP